MKKLLSIMAFAFLAVILSVTVFALDSSGYCGGDYKKDFKNLTWNIMNGTLTISGEGIMSNYSAQSGRNGYSTSAYWGHYNSLDSLIIEKGVTSVGDYAFYHCSSFNENLILPDSIVSIGKYAFEECGIDEYYFEGDAPTVYYSFDRSDLIYYPVGNDTWEIVDGRWNGYIAKEWNPNAVAMGYCGGEGDGTNVEWIIDKDGVLTIFGNGKMADFNLYGYTGSTAPWKQYNSDINTLVIEEGVTTIGNYAFFSCSDFEGSTVIPKSIIGIGWKSFANCGINEFYFKGNVPDVYSAISDYHSFDESFDTIYYPSGNSTWKTSNGKWKEYTARKWNPDALARGYCGGEGEGKNLIWELSKNGVLTISGTGIMADYSKVYTNGGYISTAPWIEYADMLQTLIIEKGVTSIGEAAFYYCIGFTGKLIIPDSVTNIGKSSFEGCDGFSGSLVLSKSVVDIGYSSFKGCLGLSGNITLPDSVKNIGGYAFCDCFGITGNLVIPDNVKTIGYGAFSGCLGFTGNLVIPNSVEKIEGCAFKNCSGFTGELIIPNGITTIEAYTFNGCSGFTGDIVIPDSVTDIGYEAFVGCGINDYYFMGDAPILNKINHNTYNFDVDSDTIYYPQNNSTWKIVDGKWNGYTAVSYSNEPDTLYGDVNGDGNVNVLDANLVRRYSAKLIELNEKELLAADVNGDNNINVLDANIIRRYSAKLIDKLPVK